MKIIKGELWNSNADLICVTTNGMLSSHLNLVMGAGSAKEARDKYPYLPNVFGKQINTIYKKNKEENGNKYGLVVVNIFDNFFIGGFQTKYDYKDKSCLDLIKYSTNCLLEYLLDKPNVTVALPYPGIGYGGLNKDDVLPIITVLPDIVTIYER